MHGPNPGYKAGDNWCECPRCGFDYYASELKKEWTGKYVCKKCWEPRHPQDFVRGREEKIAADISYPPQTQNSHAAGSITADDL